MSEDRDGLDALARAEDTELAARRRVMGRDAQDAPGMVSALADADERVIESALRPRRLTEFTGQARVREQLSLIRPAPCGAAGHRTTCCCPARPAWARPRSR